MFVKAVIINDNNGSDLILFKSKKKLAVYPFDGYQDFEVRAAKGYGKKWVEDNFADLPIEIITV